MSAPAVSGPATTGFGLDDLRAVLGQPISDEQAAVVCAPLTPGVVVAGAGSGKTATMVARVVWLVARGEVRPEGVLGLTFTSKAADELASRVRTALRTLRASGRLPASADDGSGGDEPGEPTVSTYHAYAGRLVREHALRVGREPTARILTPASSWQLAARVVGSYDGPLADKAESTVVQQVLALAGDLAEHLVVPDAVRRLSSEMEQMATASGVQKPGRDAVEVQRDRAQLLPLVESYTRLKRERDALDFGDVVALAAELARDCPEVGALERASFPVVLLDEYQDTGVAQELLLSALFGAQPAAGARPSAVLAVGDPCQSIYGWRGASAGTLRRFPNRFGAAGPALHLSTTYRSGGRVLQLANAVAGELRREGLVVPGLAPAPGREHDGEVRCALLPDDTEQARWVAGSVRAAVLAHADGASPRWASAAVLCRKRSMFPALRAAFDALEVPVEVVGLGGLLDVPEVADVVATLRVLDDPTADASLLRLLTGPRWRLGPRDLVALGRQARGLAVHDRVPDDPVEAVVAGADEQAAGSLVDALDALPDAGTALDARARLSPRGHERLVRLRDELRALRRRLDQPLPELVLDVERTLLLDVEVVARPGAAAPGEARADLDAFTEAAARFAGEASRDGGGEAVLSAFLAFLSAAEDEENGLDAGAPSAGDTVKLMTVHAAKGLEWPIVAVPGLAGSDRGSQVFPGRPRGTSWLKIARLLPFSLRGDAGDLPRLSGLDKQAVADFERELRARDDREERRLAYVAFTRAETLLLCSGYHWGEGKNPLGPSVFLQEAREACEAGAGVVERWDEPAERPSPPADAEQGRWPAVELPAGPAVQEAATRVRSLLAAPAGGLDGGAVPQQLSLEAAALVARWDDELRLLAEEQDRRRAGREDAPLPSSLSVTTLVELQRDPGGVARALRRPLPRRPSPVSRRGTAFHAWLEQVYALPQLLAPDELPGAADAGAAEDADLHALQEAFRASDWWGRTPLEVEVPFEMVLSGHLVRGRIDAVFAGPAGGFDVVDWKTGREPRGEQARAAAVQLAAYRLAWAHLAGVAPASVRAAFHYVASGVTVRPVDLLDAEGLAALVAGPGGDAPSRR